MCRRHQYTSFKTSWLKESVVTFLPDCLKWGWVLQAYVMYASLQTCLSVCSIVHMRLSTMTGLPDFGMRGVVRFFYISGVA